MRLPCLLVILSALIPAVTHGQVRTVQPTTMHVVLLTFIDTAPHHYTRVQTTTPATPGTITLTPGDSSYTLDDFSRKFGVTGTCQGTARFAQLGSGSK